MNTNRRESKFLKAI